MAKKENWIQDAIKKPGALRRTAKKAGGMTKGGTISEKFLDSAASKRGKLGQRARLAKTLKKFK